MDRTRSRRATLSAALGIALVAVAGFSAFAPAASAQTKRTTEDVGLGFKGIGARIGLVDPEGASSTVDLGVHIDAGELARNIRIAPIVEYWSVGQDVGPYNADLKDFSLGADLNIDFPLQDSRVTPYAGGGLGLHWIKATTNVPNIADQSETKLGLNIQGGVRTDVMPNLALFGELRYNFVSDANQLKLLGGFTYRFIY
ncbi:MAG TPA: outer membrane beta-barrel protein [Candidatus Limnocylindrales bacterium]|nr:outer membrane beta-barrel protein [Candidatus Limnocylindrales bacterium]